MSVSAMPASGRKSARRTMNSGLSAVRTMRKKATDSAVKISAAATQKTVCSRSRRRF